MKLRTWSSLLTCLTLAAACGGGGGESGGDAGTDGGDVDGSSSAEGGLAEGGADGGAGIDAAVDGPKDTTPPTFAGATSATPVDQSDVSVTWAAATDDLTPASAIAYRVYAGTSAGAEDFTTPAATSPAGATSVVAGGLHAWTSYSFVVRAVDRAGNEDTNAVEVTAKTPDTTPPAFAGAQAVTAAGATGALVTWNPATDNGSASSAIHYDVYESTTAGGEDFSTPTVATPVGATSASLTGLAEATSVYAVVRAVDAAGNEDANDREVTVATLDTTAPTFGGLSTAVASGTTIALTWTPATDMYVAPSTLVYDVYVATAAGQETFATPSFTTPAGASGFTVTNLAVATPYYVVVRARDVYGNEDTNTNELSATTLAQAPTLTGAVACDAAATTTLPSYVSISFPAATAGTYPVASYEICTTLTGGSDCAPFVATATAATAGPGETLVGAPANGVGTVTNGAALASFQSFDVYVRALDTHGNPSSVIGTQSTPCATAPSYGSDVLPYVTTACNSSHCHGNGTLPGPWSLAYWQGNTPPNLCADAGSPSPFVVPGDSAGSLIYQSVTNTYVDCAGIPQMPFGTAQNAPWGRGTNETLLQEWIDDGASDD